MFSKCEKALSGTALLVAELVAPAELAPLLDVAVEVLAESAFAGGVKGICRRSVQRRSRQRIRPRGG